MLLKGSHIRPQVKGSTHDYVIKLREQYIAQGLIQNFVLQEDIAFTSPSTAAAFCLGRSSNGFENWFAEDGKRLSAWRKNHPEEFE